jgi:hypothetical protein
LAAAQVAVQGEFLDIQGVTGVPVVVSHQGVRIEALDLWPEEAEAVRTAAARSQDLGEKLAGRHGA